MSDARRGRRCCRRNSRTWSKVVSVGRSADYVAVAVRELSGKWRDAANAADAAVAFADYSAYCAAVLLSGMLRGARDADALPVDVADYW